MPELSPQPDRRAFRLALAGIVVGGALLRVLVAVLLRDAPLTYDAPEYVLVGRLIAQGEGVVWPARLLFDGSPAQTAFHPPVTYGWFALASALGVEERLPLMLWHAVLGMGTVVLVAATAREIAGRRAGLAAAVIVAVLPNFWTNDVALGAETPAQFAVALVLLLAYRVRALSGTHVTDRLVVRAALLGGACALAALARSELALLVPLVLVPVVLGARVPPRARAAALAAALVWVVVPVAPWVWWNQQRFEEPVFVTTGLDTTLAQTNCTSTWYGDSVGYRSTWCSIPVDTVYASRRMDESQMAVLYRDLGVSYARRHLDRAPVVVAARVARTLGFWDPFEQAHDEGSEGREAGIVLAGTAGWFLAAGLGVAGLRRLRRSGEIIFPLVAPVVVTVLSGAIAFGASRFRCGAEVAMAIAASVQLAAWWESSRSADPADEADGGGDPPVPADAAAQEVVGAAPIQGTS